MGFNEGSPVFWSIHLPFPYIYIYLFIYIYIYYITWIPSRYPLYVSIYIPIYTIHGPYGFHILDHGAGMQELSQSALEKIRPGLCPDQGAVASWPGWLGLPWDHNGMTQRDELRMITLLRNITGRCENHVNIRLWFDLCDIHHELRLLIPMLTLGICWEYHWLHKHAKHLSSTKKRPRIFVWNHQWKPKMDSWRWGFCMFLLCSRYSVLGEVKPRFGQMGIRGSISLESCAAPETEVRELPPNNPEGDASLPIPASFEFPNGHLEERTQECFWRKRRQF